MRTVTQWKRALVAQGLTFLTGLIGVKRGSPLVFVWASEYHKRLGMKQEQLIRPHLKGWANRPICHITVKEFMATDPIAQQIANLGGKLISLD